jgi:8-oxo-dGTP pyrophosphatase MutT (NUDIX family)
MHILPNVPQPPTVPRLAATVMLVRAGSRGTLEVYLTRRHARSRFMPGAFVFPGGAVDEADRAIAARRLRGRCGDAAPELVIAAVRETFEEAGLLLASDATGTPARISATKLDSARTALLDGGSFGHLLATHDLWIDADRLAYYSNWITPASEPIRFDAHFFIARAPADQIAAADAREVYDGVWLAPAEALAQAERGAITLRFPTRKHLARLARFDDIDALLAHARTRIVSPVAPTDRGDGRFLLDDDAW